ncbi:MAG: hypothetical protein NW218_12220 [Saprospiraceae bacterium]|nr:hypothetical protein [Saprospiraceae bacterium]
MKTNKKGPNTLACLLLFGCIALSACHTSAHHPSFGLNLSQWGKGRLGVSSKLASPTEPPLELPSHHTEPNVKPVSLSTTTKK